MKILIADDEANNRILMQQYLDSWGSCDLVYDGTEAVEAFEMASSEGQPYDLICMDLFMPIMNGDKALQAIRAQEASQGIPLEYRTFVLIITGQEPTKEHDEWANNECTKLLIKPINRHQLYTTLQANGFFLPEAHLPAPETNTQFPDIPGIDILSGMDRVLGNADLYRELLYHFNHDHQEDIAKFRDALDANAQDQAMRILHSLKGSSGNISADRVHFAAKALENSFRQNDPPEQRNTHMAELVAAMDELLPGLQPFSTMQPSS